MFEILRSTLILIGLSKYLCIFPVCFST